MELNELNKQVAIEKDIDKLFEYQAELHEKLYKNPNSTYLARILEVCKLRIDMLREREKALVPEISRVNHNFRINARRTLTNETYSKILSLAHMTMKESKYAVKFEELKDIEA